VFAKRQPDRFVDTVSDALTAAGWKRRHSILRGAAIAAGAAAALTSVSARISSLRRRQDATSGS